MTQEVHAPTPRPAASAVPAPATPPAAIPTPPRSSPLQKVKDALKHYRDAAGKLIDKVRGDKHGNAGESGE